MPCLLLLLHCDIVESGLGAFGWAVACIGHTVACSGRVTCETDYQEPTHELINAVFVMSHNLRSFCNVKESWCLSFQVSPALVPNVRALVTASADILADICYTRQRKARQVLGECSFTMRPLREKGYRCEHRSRI